MKLVSVNVALPRLLAWSGATFKTGIFKKPVEGRVQLRTTNLDGDRQADLSVHGGPNKAVYGYPSEHYPAWSAELPELPDFARTWGAFGENFTTRGLLEADISVGDRYRIGSAVVKVTTPRLPCYKLAAKFQRDDMIERSLRSGRCGFYFAVVQEGEVGAGDEFELLSREAPTLTIAEVNSLYTSKSPNRESLQRSLDVKTLPESWRDRFRARLAEIDGQIDARRGRTPNPV
ncbi:MAG: MOSC domain-containing protein [Acidobacteriia bacterium]|nr:MOSC domain-containing protein [Terriglobia bacterium]